MEAGTEAAGRGRGRGQGSKRKASAASASLDPLQEPGSVKAELDTAPGGRQICNAFDGFQFLFSVFTSVRAQQGIA